MTQSKELVAATAEPLILSLLNRKDSYGYAILKDIELLSSHQVVWSEGMLYPVLHRLEKKNLIASYWQQSDSGRKRKYYQILTAGKKYLETKNDQWNIMHNTLTAAQELSYVGL